MIEISIPPVGTNAAQYASFKDNFAALGGSKRTPVFFGVVSGMLVACFSDQNMVLVATLTIPDGGFSADFPQVVVVPQVGLI